MPTLQFSDFDYFANDAQIQGTLSVVSPLTGASSLLIERVVGASTAWLNFAPKTTAPVTQGVTSGRLRAQVRFLNASYTMQFSLLCMQSTRSMVSAGTQAYGLRWSYTGGNLDLVRFTSGLTASVVVLAGPLSYGTVSSAFTMQLEWYYHASIGVLLYGYRGLALDFSDLESVLSHQQTVSPLTTSATEGGAFYDPSGFNFDILVDQMRLDGP